MPLGIGDIESTIGPKTVDGASLVLRYSAASLWSVPSSLGPPLQGWSVLRLVRSCGDHFLMSLMLRKQAA